MCIRDRANTNRQGKIVPSCHAAFRHPWCSAKSILKFTSTPVVRVAIPIPKCTKCLALNVLYQEPKDFIKFSLAKIWRSKQTL